MMKTLATIVLTLGLTACLENPDDENPPTDEDTGVTQPASGGDHQNPNSLQRDISPTQDTDDDVDGPVNDSPPGLTGCAPMQDGNPNGNPLKTGSGGTISDGTACLNDPKLKG